MEKGIGYTNESWQMNQLLRNYKLSKEGNVTVQRSIKGWKVDLSSMGSLAPALWEQTLPLFES